MHQPVPDSVAVDRWGRQAYLRSMASDRGSAARASVTGLGVSAAIAVTLLSGVPSAAGAPGTPGLMAAPTVVLYEGFEGSTPPATAEFVQTIADYDDGLAAPVAGYVGHSGQHYTADPAWNGQYCNGLVISAGDVDAVPVASQAAACLQAGWNQSRALAETLGSWATDPDYPYPTVPRPDPEANHAVSSYTQGDSPAGVMAATDVPVLAGHYYTATVDVAQANCWTTNPVDLSLRLDDGVSPAITTFPGPIAACDLPVHQINGNNVGTFSGFTSLLARSTTVELAFLNNLGGGGGDDNAFDNLALIDTTPQLDAVIAAPPDGVAHAAGAPARLVFTITNTHFAGAPGVPSGAKPEWSFGLTLPGGLLVSDDADVTTDCPGGILDVAASTVTGRGSLGVGDVSCSLAVDVTSSGGEYTLDPSAYTLTGLLLPAATSVRFASATTPPISPPSGGTTLADSGSEPLAALWCGGIAALLGILLLRSAAVRGRRSTR